MTKDQDLESTGSSKVVPLPSGWEWTSLESCVSILDGKRRPINSTEREKRIEGKAENQLYPYFGATGRVGSIDDYLFDDELLLLERISS